MNEEEVPAFIHRKKEPSIRRDGQAADGVGVLVGEGEAGVCYQVEGRHAIRDQAVEGVAVVGEDHIAPRVHRTRETRKPIPEAHAEGRLDGGCRRVEERGGGGRL